MAHGANYDYLRPMSNFRPIFGVLITTFLFTTGVCFAYDPVDLSRALRNPGFNPDRTSITVVDTATGNVIASHNSELALNPASCMKIITSAATLSMLGPNYSLVTDIYADKKPSAGVISTLYMYGTGDPFLVNEELERIAGEVYASGVRRISDGIVVDDTFFDSEDFPKKKGNEHRAYAAKVSAVAVNFNSAEIRLTPGKRVGSRAEVSVIPPIDYIEVVNKLTTGKRFKAGLVIAPKGDRELLKATGTVPIRLSEEAIYRSIGNPAAYAGSILKYMLEQKGIQVVGSVREGSVPESAVHLYRAKSKPLSELVLLMNKKSINFIAEQLTKHLGAVKYGVPGSTEKGVRAFGDFLRSIGIADGTYVLENGSGLSDEIRLTSKQLATILAAAYRSEKLGEVLSDSFPILGVDGTTKRWRVDSSIHGVARAKTGTLNGVSTLAGFVPTKSGRMAAFAIFANGLPRGAHAAHSAELEVVKSISEGGL